MPKKTASENENKTNGANLGFETQMWAAADKLRGHMDASEYKHVVLGLIFLKYISDAFQAKYKQLEAALEVNDSAVKVLGDETLKTIAHELVEAVRRSVTIDWTVRENTRAQIRVIVKRILRKYGYPPDKQEKATQTVLEQAKVLCKEWVTT